jgi:hypothetical protein
MQSSRIRELLQVVPKHVKLYHKQDAAPDDLVCHRDILQMAHAETDPAFAWTYASAFAACKANLPAAVAEPAIREAYDYLVSGKCGENLRGALVIRESPMKLKRGLLEALLMVSPAVPLQRVGELTCLPVAVVQIYEALFFSLTGRDGDVSFISQLAYPATRQVEFQKDYLTNVDPCDLLKRAALRGGVDVVLELMGVLTSGSNLTDKELARIMKTNILAEAAWLAQAGLVHQPLEIFKLALKLIVADAKASSQSPQARSGVAPTPMAANSQAPAFSVLEAARAVAKAVAAAPTVKASTPKEVHLAKPEEASDVSEVSEASGVSGELNFNDRLRNPDLAVSLPSRLRRRISCDLATPNCRLHASVISL